MGIGSRNPDCPASLNLDTSLSTTVTINKAILNIADYTYDNGGFEAKPVTLGFDLTLDGVTHSLSQTGTWSITPSYDSILSFSALSPVLSTRPTDRGTSASWDSR